MADNVPFSIDTSKENSYEFENDENIFGIAKEQQKEPFVKYHRPDNQDHTVTIILEINNF